MKKQFWLIAICSVLSTSAYAQDTAMAKTNRLRAGLEIGILSAEAKANYHFDRHHNLSLNFGYVVSTMHYGRYQSPELFMDNFSPQQHSGSLFWGDSKVWASLMANLSYRYYFAGKGNKTYPTGGYVGFTARYRGAQLATIGTDKTFMRPTSSYAAQVGVQDYLYRDILYFDLTMGFGIHVNKEFTTYGLAPVFAVKLGWNII